MFGEKQRVDNVLISVSDGCRGASSVRRSFGLFQDTSEPEYLKVNGLSYRIDHYPSGQ